MQRLLVIAIDGPSGAGKGTVARTVAARLAYRHIDTGAMYRAVAWNALRSGVRLEDATVVAAVAARAVFDLGARVCIDGEDVTEAIRTPEIDRAAGVIAQHPAVREVLVERQRSYGEHGGVVMEGRDIGSVVFPQADVKMYLDAAPEERARRRAADPSHAAGGAALTMVAEALEARDRRDRTRDISPLRLAPDAVYIDTTHLGVEEVVVQVMRLVEARRQIIGDR